MKQILAREKTLISVNMNTDGKYRIQNDNKIIMNLFGFSSMISKYMKHKLIKL